MTVDESEKAARNKCIDQRKKSKYVVIKADLYRYAITDSLFSNWKNGNWLKLYFFS